MWPNLAVAVLTVVLSSLTAAPSVAQTALIERGQVIAERLCADDINGLLTFIDSLAPLFESDDGGWLQDPRLLDRLVAEKLEREAEAVRAEGWKWIEIAPDFPYGHTYGLRRLSGTEVPPSEEETAARDALKAEFERLEEEYADAEELPEEVDRRLGEIETALEAFDQRPVLYDAAEVAPAGAFVSIEILHGPQTSIKRIPLVACATLQVARSDAW